jgi:hypothetical protein
MTCMGLHLNLGCGRSPLNGWVNVDIAALPGVDVVADLDGCRTQRLPFTDNTVSKFQMSHVLEHIGDTLALMQELHRIAEPGASLIIRSPYGSSDDADEDPTHRHRLFLNSFGYFSQPYYWRADYGYRGDWGEPTITLLVGQSENAGLSFEEVLRRVRQLRNVVVEMVAELAAIKPIRPAERSLQRYPTVRLEFV